MVLVHRDRRRNPIGRTGRGENDLVDPGRLGCPKQRDRPGDVVIVVGARIPNRLADLDRCREMYDGLRLVFLQNVVESFAISNITGLERPPFDKFRVTIREVVIDDRREALVEEVEARM